MKRILIVLLIIVSLVICLPACNQNDPSQSQNTTPTTPTTPQIEENPDFAAYNEMFKKEFVNYTIDVSVTSVNDEVINDKYTIKLENGSRSVAYRIERLNHFIIDGDQIIIPDEYISVEEGVYDTATSANEKFDVPSFNFSYSCLSDADTTVHNMYSTKVNSLTEFMGLSVDATDASVKLSFEGDEARSITVSYVSENENTVIITYTFN